MWLIVSCPDGLARPYLQDRTTAIVTTEDISRIVVIGAGQAAIAFAAQLRELDPVCAITLIGEEPVLPYQRPPLSKKYITGELAGDRLLLRPLDWYEQAGVTCITSARATAVSVPEKIVHLDDGRRLPFDKLLLATGSTPRRLPAEIGGGDSHGVFMLRNMADADAIAAQLRPGRKVLIVGGGYIGLEAAAVAAAKGLEVTVCEMAERILQRVAARETADYFRRLHEGHGVRILEGMRLSALDAPDSRVVAASFADGARIDVDFVLVGIGVIPNVDLAAGAGLTVDNGIAVDDTARSSHPDIYAAGDCASFMFHGKRVRLESVQNAIDQAEIAAHNVAGIAQDYRPVPWFWSDQYDCKLQIAGLNAGYDIAVLRPGRRPGSQSVWYFADGAFIAVDAINDPRAYMFGKRILEMDREISPKQAADANFELKSLFD
jgi:3-phenylpropionate/trans-cinnamate dioxygenase ferredoxin reductase component